MEKNKSIDGLAPRRSKKSATTGPAPKKSTKSTKVSASRAKSTAKSAKSKSTAVKRVAKPVATVPTSAPTPQPKSESDVTADFLKPTNVFNFDEQSGELQASTDPIDTSTKSKRKQKKEKKPVSKKRKIITSIILIIVLLLIGGVTWVVLWGNDIIAKITGGQGNIFDLITFTEPTYEPLKTDANGRTNILAFGTSGYNMEGDEGDGTHDGAQLTDSIMVISLNQETGDIVMLSLPRDLKASPTCTATGKINEVYWCNGGGGDASTEEEAAAATALMNEVGSILGIDFQYYAHLNWGSLISIVNTLGGINITLDEDIADYYYTGAVFEAGTQYTIDGEQALGLARARHGTADGDFTRGASQQKILIGIKDKVLEKDLSLTDLISLASTLGDNLRTNFAVEELKTMAHIAIDFDLDSIRQVSLLEPERLMTTGTINGISYVLPAGGVGYYTRIQDFITKMFSNDPRVYEEPSILVLNGTDTAGLASAEQTTLESDGYTNITVDNAPEGTYTDKYTLYYLTDSAPGTKHLLEEKYGLEARPLADLPEGISKDYDFILVLGGNSEQSNQN